MDNSPSDDPRIRLIAALLAGVVGGAIVVLVAVDTDEVDEPDVQEPPVDEPVVEQPPAEQWIDAVDFTEPSEGHDVDPLGEITFGPTTTVTAFFPAQANLQWLAEDVEDYDHPVAGDGTRTEHPGGALTTGCAECHSAEGAGPTPAELGERLVGGPAGVDDKTGSVDVDVRAAFDDEYLYLQASWTSQRSRPGITHDSFQFVDGDWRRNTTGKDDDRSRPDQLEEGEWFDYEDRLAVTVAPEGHEVRAFGDEGPTFDEVGCVVGCHASMRNMPEQPESDRVRAHEYLGDEGLGRDDIRHYLLDTRAEADRYDPDGAWASIGDDYDGRADREAGNYLDLWQYRGGRSAPMYGASNDYVMEYRHSGEGGDNYWFNQSPTDQQVGADELIYDGNDHVWRDAGGEAVDPSDYAWMYDIAEAGFHGLPAEAIDDEGREISARWATRYPLIVQGPDRNAVPLERQLVDEGDILPRRVLRYATGVRGRTRAFSRWDPATDTYSVVFRSPIEGAESDLEATDLLEGGNLVAGLAVFDDHSSNRFHHVTFPVTVGPGDEADVRALDLRAD